MQQKLTYKRIFTIDITGSRVSRDRIIAVVINRSTKFDSVYVVTCISAVMSFEIDFVYFIRILGDHLSAAPASVSAS